jgi:hypothetical protein
MSKRFAINFAIVCVFALLFSSCNNDNGSDNNSMNVSGTWRAQLTVDTCSPSDLCSQTGLVADSTATAIMTLDQNGTKVNGTYTYEGTGISADVSGNIAGNQLVLDGSVTQLLGKVTVHLEGTVLNNQMQSSVSHNVTLNDGRSGSITGSGNFSRS